MGDARGAVRETQASRQVLAVTGDQSPASYQLRSLNTDGPISSISLSVLQEAHFALPPDRYQFKKLSEFLKVLLRPIPLPDFLQPDDGRKGSPQFSVA